LLNVHVPSCVICLIYLLIFFIDESKQNGGISSQANSKEFDPLQGEEKNSDDNKHQSEPGKGILNDLFLYLITIKYVVT
jgi:hypothetical protein